MPVGKGWRVIGAVASAAALALAGGLGASVAQASMTVTRAAVTIFPGQPAQPGGAPFMGLGVQWDPYDTFVPTQADWNLTFARVAYMHPGFIRVVEPASEYFEGYDSNHDPVYRWTSQHVLELLQILSFAQSHGITVVLGDWANPLIHNDARIPADFIAQLHSTYGFTEVKYYDPINEPNYNTSCAFSCWTHVMGTLSSEFQQLGISSWLQLIGPDNGNSWDDTASAQAADRNTGLDTDNPVTDVWVTQTLQTIPKLIGAYDSHRYATIWGIEHGVYEDQMRARRQEISNLDSPTKAYFEGEVGLTARQTSPFSADFFKRALNAIAAAVDPSAQGAPTAHASASSFVDSQPHIAQFEYGVWMGDMMIQAIEGGLSGASAWDLDDAMHTGGGYGSQNLKQWGFWNSFGGQDGYPASDLNLRPWYYTWSVLSRTFPAGSTPLMTVSTRVPGLRVAAAEIPRAHGDALSFAVVNDSNSSRQVKLTMPNVKRRPTLARYDYFGTDRPTDANGFPTPAAILKHVSLAKGVTVKLPSAGVVVLTSTGGPHGVPFSDGRGLLLDPLNDWSKVASHSRYLKFDHSAPGYFNDDLSRVTPSRKGTQYLIYRARRITSFELEDFYQRSPAVTAFSSPDGKKWTAVKLASTNPAPALAGGGWYLGELLPAVALPSGTNELKLELSSSHTELAEVRLGYGRG